MAGYDILTGMSDVLNVSSCVNCSTPSSPGGPATATPPPKADRSDIWPWRVGLFGVGGTVIACVGIVSNIITIVVLTHYRTKSTAPFLLISLAVFDTLFLFSEMFLEPLTYMAQGGLISDTYRDFITPLYW
ncbi:FMRFamide receptor-like [Elysia marginata]|uniref:FMRFamide receptor-like n=1 Tax=Elysia marginata TaxID=1093978 RepID=A0AAV4FD52_9GAST|nr:FMRFamide receptor-like [Elysia marginata]